LGKSHSWDQIVGYADDGDEIITMHDSRFTLHLGLANMLPQDVLEHEIPTNLTSQTALEEWLARYIPYGAYVYQRSTRLSSSGNTLPSDIEPNLRRWNDTLNNPKHPYGEFMFFNDRSAPVRFDRALGWERPFDDQCDHRDYHFNRSTDFVRSPFTGAAERLVVGANGVLHVFDAVLGRMDFNAETFEKIS
jgi:hypothetical protein